MPNKHSKESHTALVQAYQSTFRSAAGQIVLRDLMAQNFVFGTTLHDNSNIMASREGQRSVLVNIIAMLNTSPEDIEKYYRDIKADALQWSKD